VSDLAFLSPNAARADSFAPRMTSPLALAHARPSGIEDVSLSTGKLEVRGDLTGLGDDADVEVIRVTPERALVLCEYERAASLLAELLGDFRATVDLTGALAGLRIDRPDAERLLRRLTELDLDRLPAVGAVARVPVHVLRDGPTAFRLFFPQEYGHYFAEVVIDAAEGLEVTR
jgi:sarcosine oxidase gamma subunit